MTGRKIAEVASTGLQTFSSQMRNVTVLAGKIRYRMHTMSLFLAFLISTLTAGSYFTESVYAEESAVAVKHRLQQRIQNDLAGIEEALTASESMDPAMLSLFKSMRKETNAFLVFVNRQDPESLPRRLVDYYIQKDREQPVIESPFLESYLVFTGEPVVQPLIDVYGDQPPVTKHSILSLLGQIKSPQALSLVRQEIHSQNPIAPHQAIIVLRLILGSEARDELYVLLDKQDQESSTRETILRQLRLAGDPDWFATVLRIASQNKIEFSRLSILISDIKQFPEDSLGTHIPFLIQMTRRQDNQSRYIAVQLLSVIKQRPNLLKLYPIFEDLLWVRYDCGRKTNVTGQLTSTPNDSDMSVSAWSHREATILILRIENALTAAEIFDWLARQPEKLISRVYLQNWLQKKQATAPTEIVNTVTIEVSVLDQQGKVVAFAIHPMPVGKHITMQGTPLISGYPRHRYEGMLVFDLTNGRLKIKDFKIHFKPHGVVFDAVIPFEGAQKIVFHESSQGNSEKYTWIFKHKTRKAS
jgi:HEAT repeat protein